MFTGWNLLGWLFWIIAIILFIAVIHSIRVRQIKLIIETHRSFKWTNFIQYIVMVIISLALLGIMVYLTFLRPVDIHDSKDVSISTDYQPLVLTSIKKDFYYAQAQEGKGRRPIVSYSFWVRDNKLTISSDNATVSSGSKPINQEAKGYPWNERQLLAEDTKTNRAYAATITARYKDNFINGLGCRVGRNADQFTLIRVPSDQFVHYNK